MSKSEKLINIFATCSNIINKINNIVRYYNDNNINDILIIIIDNINNIIKVEYVYMYVYKINK